MKDILILVVIFMAFSCKKSKKEVKKPNILLIVVDDLGYSDFTPFK
ncbi:hypothetical protein [Polaribacter sp. L3A8]|nr:hypothetical protein [Polaribacter sp. L3A8]